MKTSKPISTISYNSIEFLKNKLKVLEEAHIIDFWFFVKHKPEDDEAGNKEHFHLYVEPAKLLNTVDLREQFKEPDINNTLPLGCIKFQCSKFPDAYMYFLHDTCYLAFKGQSRRYHYKKSDIVTNDPVTLRYKEYNIDLLELTPYADMQQAQKEGLSFHEYFKRGRIPINQVSNFERAWHLLKYNITDRNGREGHE